MDRIRHIVEIAASVFGRTPDELLGRSRRHPIVEARQAAMWAVRQSFPSISLIDIGDAIGGRHYTTVTHAIAATRLRAAHDAVYAERLQHLLTATRPAHRQAEQVALVVRRQAATYGSAGTL